jgi:hypothetical protein
MFIILAIFFTLVYFAVLMDLKYRPHGLLHFLTHRPPRFSMKLLLLFVTAMGVASWGGKRMYDHQQFVRDRATWNFLNTPFEEVVTQFNDHAETALGGRFQPVTVRELEAAIAIGLKSGALGSEDYWRQTLTFRSTSYTDGQMAGTKLPG